MSRARAKQDRWSSGVWARAAEMLDARTLLTGRVLNMENGLFFLWIRAQYILDKEQMAALLHEKAILAALPVSPLRTDGDSDHDTDTLTYDGIMDVIIHERDCRLDEDAVREAQEIEEMAAAGTPTCRDCGETSWWCKACNDPDNGRD